LRYFRASPGDRTPSPQKIFSWHPLFKALTVGPPCHRLAREDGHSTVALALVVLLRTILSENSSRRRNCHEAVSPAKRTIARKISQWNLFPGKDWEYLQRARFRARFRPYERSRRAWGQSPTHSRRLAKRPPPRSLFTTFFERAPMLRRETLGRKRIGYGWVDGYKLLFVEERHCVPPQQEAGVTDLQVVFTPPTRF